MAERSLPRTRRPRLWPRLGRTGRKKGLNATAPAATGEPWQDDSTGHEDAVRHAALPPLLLTNPVVAPTDTASSRDCDRQTAADDSTPYLAHFDLSTRPFSLLPDPNFLFWSPSHERAHAVLEYGLMSRAPLTVVTGEIGAGKTTLVHQILRGLGAGIRVGLISNASDLRGELLSWVLSALGENPVREAEPAAIFEAFQACLIDTYAGGRRVVLIFDEAQTLGRDRLEELRMLTNINSVDDVLLQIVLVGQPDLRDTIMRPDMWQFAQRVAASFHLPAMNADVQARYIAHRVSVAGADRPLFEDSALSRLYEATGGVPRLTNQLCDLAMLYAYSADKPVVDAACVQHVIDGGVLLGAGPRPGGPAAEPAQG